VRSALLFVLPLCLCLSACVLEEPAPAPAFDSGVFDPVFEDEEGASPAVDVPRRLGWYHREGETVWCSIDVEWSNSDPALRTVPARVRLPFEPADDFIQSATGSVRLQQLGTDAPVFVRLGEDGFPVGDITTLNVSMDLVTGSLVVVGAERAGGEQVVLTYGTGHQRVVASVTYRAAQ
jgi:hypothetical protein